jgi:hypothetical protein
VQNRSGHRRSPPTCIPTSTQHVSHALMLPRPMETIGHDFIETVCTRSPRSPPGLPRICGKHLQHRHSVRYRNARAPWKRRLPAHGVMAVTTAQHPESQVFRVLRRGRTYVANDLFWPGTLRNILAFICDRSAQGSVPKRAAVARSSQSSCRPPERSIVEGTPLPVSASRDAFPTQNSCGHFYDLVGDSDDMFDIL